MYVSVPSLLTVCVVKAHGGQTPSRDSTVSASELYVLDADEIPLVKGRQKNREDVIISAGSKLY